MKRIFWIALALILTIGVLTFAAWRAFSPGDDLFRPSKINEMAEYLNEKYGYDVSIADCTYFRKEDYSYHDAFPSGITYDVPNIAIFNYQGKRITVTDRNGFMGDDVQLGDIQYLFLPDYFTERTGIETAYVEVRRSYNGNIKDETLNELLHHTFNKKITPENVEEFVQLLWEVDSLELIFYYKPTEDIDTQVQKITRELGFLQNHSNLENLRFYITTDKYLRINNYSGRVGSQTANENNRESDESYVWAHAYVGNEVEYHYSASESSYYFDAQLNSFVVGGYCMLDRGYSGGFGNRDVTQINNFGVVDLSDAKLEEYLQEMVNYGQYRGYTVLFRAGEAEGLANKITIADGTKYNWTFRWGNGPIELYTFKHGRLLELKTAYECGYLSPDDMDAILQVHKDHFGKYYIGGYEAAQPRMFDYDRFQVTREEVEAQHQKYGKKYCEATTEMEYALDGVIIIVYPFANHVTYTPDDFAEIGCTGVQVLTEGNPERDEHNKIIFLKIPNSTKQGILDAIKLLEQRPDIYVAQPNYIYHIQ